MAGARKKILNTAIIAVAVIAAATLFFFLTIMFTFNKEAAICDYLDKNGVTQEDLSLIVSGSERVADTFKGDETSYYEGVNALYALAVKAADNRAVVEGAVDAYYNASRIGNPFAVLKYSSILQELAPLKDKISCDTSSAVGEKEIGESVRQILKICEGIAENGKNSFDEAAKTLRAALVSENLQEEVSYKSLINLALYAVEVTKEADFSKTYLITDAIFGSGFGDMHAEGIKSATAVLRSADYDTLLSLSGYLPDTGIFAAAVCNYASNVQGFDKTAFCKTFSAAMNALYRKQGKNATLDDFEVQANFNVLAEADPDALSEQDKAEIKTAAEYFLSAFSLFREN